MLHKLLDLVEKEDDSLVTQAIVLADSLPLTKQERDVFNSAVYNYRLTQLIEIKNTELESTYMEWMSTNFGLYVSLEPTAIIRDGELHTGVKLTGNGVMYTINPSSAGSWRGNNKAFEFVQTQILNRKVPVVSTDVLEMSYDDMLDFIDTTFEKNLTRLEPILKKLMDDPKFLKLIPGTR